MEDLLEKKTYKKLAFYTKGFLDTTEEDWIDYKEDYSALVHLLDEDFIESENEQVEITDDYSLEVPIDLKEIAEEIEKAVDFLKNCDDWDPDEGELYSFATLKNAATFLVDYSIWVFKEHDLIIPTPKIYPGPDRTIDILWKNDQCKLLLNIKSHPDLSATFYGKSSEGDEFIEGKFKIGNINQSIFLFLFEQQN